MFYSLNLYSKDRWIRGAFLLALVFQAWQWWYFFANIHPSSEQLFLHYNVLFGVDLIGEWWRMLFLPMCGAGILVFNTGIGLMLYRTEKPLARSLVFFAFLVQLFLAVALYFMIGLNS